MRISGGAGVGSLPASMATVNGGEEDQVDDEKESAQHKCDTQGRLIGPEKAQSTSTCHGRRCCVVALVVVGAGLRIGIVGGRWSARLGCHDVRIDQQRPVSVS